MARELNAPVERVERALVPSGETLEPELTPRLEAVLGKSTIVELQERSIRAAIMRAQDADYRRLRAQIGGF